MRIEGNAKTIRQLLANTKYELDYYQREYSWQSKHVIELLDDLSRTFLESYTEDDAPTNVQNYKHYFLGSIIISHSSEDGKRYIVDGQQRLATLTLLLIRLYHLLEDEALKNQVDPLIYSLSYGTVGFNLDVPEWEPVMKALYEGSTFDGKGKSGSIRNIAARYSDVEDHFEIQDSSLLPSFVYWLLENVYLVEITAYNSKDAYAIFETVNDRGLSLTPADMLRGYLLSNIDDPERRNHASEIWREQVQDLQNIDREADADAIKAWLRSQYAESVQDFDRIGSEFHRWVREHEETLDLTTNGFAKFIERDFAFYSDWYCRLQRAGKSLTPGLECVYYNERHNFTLQYPVLLAPLRVGDTDTEALSKIQIGATYLDILIHRRIWNLQDVTQRTMADSMFSVMHAIRGTSGDELGDILYKLLEAATLAFASNRIFHLHGANRRKIFLILARMTDYLGVQSGQASRYPEYLKTGKSSYEVEHIWANHPENHLDEFSHEFEFEAYRNRLGGLLLLPKQVNASFGDLSYAEKREYYLRENLLAQSLHEQGYGRNPGFRQFIERTKLPFRAHPEFKKADLDARQQLYQQLAERIWNPERLRLPHGEEPETVEPENDPPGKTRESENSYNVWTIEQVRNLVPSEHREHYERQSMHIEFYRQVSDLLNLIEETGWLLTLKFQKHYCGFYLEGKRVFGVNFINIPRFAVWIAEEKAELLNTYCKFERYLPRHRCAVYPRGTTVEQLRPIYECAYESVSGNR